MGTKYGRKRTPNSDGKLVDTWHYHYKGLVREAEQVEPEDEDEPITPTMDTKAGDRVVQVRLYIVKKTQAVSEPPHTTIEVKFRVECEDPEFEYEGTDCEALRSMAWDALDERFKIRWEQWFLVRVNHCSNYEGTGTGLAFSYDSVEKGHTHDDKELLRRYLWGGKREVTPWPGVFKTKDGSVQACILSTKENRLALEEFQKRIDVLREKLQDYLAPDVITQNLLELAGCALLPSPTKQLANGSDIDLVAAE